jgi:hypothetical protein
MQYRKFAFFTVGLLALGSLWSCEYEKIEPPDLPPATDTIYYSTQIQPIWDKGCVGCHGAGQDAPNLTAAESYNALISGNFINIADPASSIIYTEMIPGGNMSSHTNQSEANFVLVWIQQGAKNN